MSEHGAAGGPSIPLGELLNFSFLLKVARTQFHTEDPDHGRSGARNTIIAAIHFISRVLPDGPELVLPLKSILYGLEDLDNGHVPPILTRAKLGKKGPVALGSRITRAMAAALMDLYQQAGQERRASAISASQKMNHLGYRDDKRMKISATQVENWRDTMKENQGADDLPARQYATTLSMLAGMFPGKPERAAEFFLQNLPFIEPT